MNKGYKGKNVLISGGASGIGLEFARCLLDEGAQVILIDNDASHCARAGNILHAHGQVEILCLDLSLPGVRQAVCDDLGRRNIHIDILINNVAIHHHGDFLSLPWDRITQIVEVNVMCALHLCHLFANGMAARGLGQILNISSTAGLLPCPDLATYSATKAFINRFSEALAIELAERGVKVQWICIGATDTAFFESSGMGGLRYVKAIKKMTPRQVAADGVRFLKSRRFWTIIGWRNRLNIFLCGWIPAPLLRKVARRRFR